MKNLLLGFSFAAVGVMVAASNAACEQADPERLPDGSIKVEGRERLEWEQAGPSLDTVNGYRYVAVVGRDAHDLKDVKCAAKPAGDGFVCRGPLPPLTPGIHQVWIIAVATDDKRVLVSRWNPPLTLVKQ